MKRHSCDPTKYVPAGSRTSWPAGWRFRLLVQSASQLGAHGSPGAFVKFRFYLCYKWSWCCGYSTLLASASPHFLWCSILALSIPPSWHASSTTRPLHRLYLGTSLPSSSSLIYSFQSNRMYVFFRKDDPDEVKVTPSHLHCSRHLSIRVIITTRILYLLVLNSIYCLLWNVSCLRGHNTPVLLIDLYRVPGTVSQLVTTL